MAKWATGLSSMGWRIQGWYAGILVVVVSGLMVMVYRIEHQRQAMLLDVEAEALIQHVLPEISPRARAAHRAEGGPPAGIRRPRPRADGDDEGPGARGYGGPRRVRPGPRLPMDQDPTIDPDAGLKRAQNQVEYERRIEGGAFVVVWNDNETVLMEEGQSPAGLSYREARMRPVRETLGEYRTVWRTGAQRRTIVAGIPLQDLRNSMAAFRNELVVYGVAIVSTVLLVGLIVVRRALSPVGEISETAVEISQGDLSRRIDVEQGCTELASLGHVLNECFERLEENFNQQQRFTADASHELRTPVSVLLSTSQRMLANHQDHQQCQEAFEVCERSAMRMKRLVDELTELARFDSGEAKLALDDEDLSILADCIAADLEPLAAERQVTIRRELESAPCRIDAARIEQVLTNLVTNAIRHNPESTEVVVKTGTDGAGSFLEVRDDGSGIEEEDQARLFDRFYQVGHQMNRHRGGSGLGLAICKAIVDRHQGELAVTSELGRGTSFRVSLPRV